MIKLFARPQFSLVDTDKDEPVLIRGTKTKGLIALLALAPDYTRSRAWVKKKLWSDRSEEQAAGSLRQCISDIKKSLGVHNHILISDSINLSLDNSLFCLDATPASQLANDIPELGYEYLEDLDSIKDRQFCLWLASIREKNREKHKAAHARPRSSVIKPGSSNFVVIFDQSFGNGLHENVLGNQLLTSVSKFLLEIPNVTIVGSKPTDENPLKTNQVRGCHLSVQLQGNEQSMIVRVGLESIADRRLLWSDQVVMAKDDGFGLHSLELLSLTGSLASKFSEIVNSNDDWVDANVLSSHMLNKAVTGIFSLDKLQMQNADKLLSNIYDTNPAGQFLAWRAFLRSLAFFQHRDTFFLESDISSTNLASEALRASPSNSVSLLVTSQFEYLHRGNSEASLHFAKESVKKNPLNALAWAVLSNTQLVGGRNKDAVESAQRALALGANSPCRHYLEFFVCMALSSIKEYNQAAVHAEISLAYSKSFTAPLRYLLPLYKATKQNEKYEFSLKRLKALEPDFSVERYTNADYPVNTLRKISLIDFVL